MRAGQRRFDQPWGQYLLVAAACCAVAAGILGNVLRRPIDHAPGELVRREPLQSAQVDSRGFALGDYALTPRARFDVEARVLSTERYRFDAGAGLAPFDFALGWGPMSDSAVIDRLEIRQSSRFYTLYPADESTDVARLLRYSSNMHLIPANAAIADLLQRVRVGHVVRLEGLLVDANRSDGYGWRTSLSREDSGAGACELVYVERVSFW